MFPFSITKWTKILVKSCCQKQIIVSAKNIITSVNQFQAKRFKEKLLYIRVKYLSVSSFNRYKIIHLILTSYITKGLRMRLKFVLPFAFMGIISSYSDPREIKKTKMTEMLSWQYYKCRSKIKY